MTDMQIAVRLWWETSLQTTTVLALGKILLHLLLYEIEALLLFLILYFFCHILLLFCFQITHSEVVFYCKITNFFRNKEILTKYLILNTTFFHNFAGKNK